MQFVGPNVARNDFSKNQKSQQQPHEMECECEQSFWHVFQVNSQMAIVVDPHVSVGKRTESASERVGSKSKLHRKVHTAFKLDTIYA